MHTTLLMCSCTFVFCFFFISWRSRGGVGKTQRPWVFTHDERKPSYDDGKSFVPASVPCLLQITILLSYLSGPNEHVSDDGDDVWIWTRHVQRRWVTTIIIILSLTLTLTLTLATNSNFYYHSNFHHLHYRWKILLFLSTNWYLSIRWSL